MINTRMQSRNERAHHSLSRRRAYRARWAWVIAAATMSAGVYGCSDSTGIPALSADPFMTVTLNVQSATMSTIEPYHTLQLVATSRSASGTVLSDSVETEFRTEDAKLSVSPTGLVTAKETTPRTWVAVIARDPRRHVTHTDTVFITVTDVVPPSPLATFAIQRPPNDSAKVGVYDPATGFFADTVAIVAKALDGTDLTWELPVHFTVSDSSIATVDPQFGIVKGVKPGSVTIFASTTYYGVTKTDSFQLAIGNPLVASIIAEIRASSTVPGKYIREFVPSSITIGVGGTIFFGQGLAFNGPALDMDVVFDDPSAAQPSSLPEYVLLYPNGSGNIGPIPSLLLNGQINPACLLDFAACQGAIRSFPVAGTYHYRSALFGTKGVIIVKGP